MARLYKYRVPDFEAKEEDRKINLPDTYAYDNSVSEKGQIEADADQTKL